MSKTYAVHYGNGHIINGKVLDEDFDELEEAKEAARALVALDRYDFVTVASTDGEEWNMVGEWDEDEDACLHSWVEEDREDGREGRCYCQYCGADGDA